MTVLSWNCGGWTCGGFTENKLNAISSKEYDIFIVQEITKREYETVLAKYLYKVWYGDDIEESYKGIAIFSDLYEIKLNPIFNPEFRYIVPYDIYSGKIKLLSIFSVWTKKPSNESGDYQKQLFDAMKYYKYKEPHIVIGDFNTGSNAEHLERYEELLSALKKHTLVNCAINTEYEYNSTFYHEKLKKYYTNDFCFISEGIKGYPIRILKKGRMERD